MDNETTTVRETVTSHSPNSVSQTRTVSRKSFLGDFFVSKINQIIFGILGIISLLLLLRIFFLAADANRVGIVSWLIDFTNIFVAPFQGIFAAPATGNTYIDVAAILAIIIWSIAATILSVVLDWFSSSTK